MTRLLPAICFAAFCIAGAMAADAPEAKLPKAMLIGDSISGGYKPHVAKVLDGKAEVVIRRTGTTGQGLADIDKFIGDEKWDVIHFNWGLHDLCYRHPDAKPYGHRDKVNGTIGTTLEQYEKNLEKLVTRLEKTGAKLIFATTTVVPEGEAGRFVGDDVKYNAVALKVMKKHGIAVNDLHALTKGFDKNIFVSSGDVHYKQEGYAKIGDRVAGAIRTALYGESASE